MILDPIIWLWLPIIVSTLLAFTSWKKSATILLVISLISSLVAGRMEIYSVLTSIAFLALAATIPIVSKHDNLKTFKYVSWFVLLTWCTLLFLHRFPGFHNLQVLDNVSAGVQSTPFSMYLNLDKPLAFFALLFAYPVLLGNPKKVQILPLLLTLMFLSLLLPLAVIIGVIKPELSFPSWWWLFALNNLMITCVAEEALFRGFIQHGLAKNYKWTTGLAVASLLFGIAHIAGGPVLVLFATLAGIGYGLVFHFTGRLWCSVLAHFAFNFSHLIFFTYPVLAR